MCVGMEPMTEKDEVSLAMDDATSFEDEEEIAARDGVIEDEDGTKAMNTIGAVQEWFATRLGTSVERSDVDGVSLCLRRSRARM